MSGNVECKRPYFAKTIGLDTQIQENMLFAFHVECYKTKSADFQIANKLWKMSNYTLILYCYWQIPV